MVGAIISGLGKILDACDFGLSAHSTSIACTTPHQHLTAAVDSSMTAEGVVVALAIASVTPTRHPDGGLLWVWNKKGQEANRERSCLLIGGAPGMHIDITALIN